MSRINTVLVAMWTIVTQLGCLCEARAKLEETVAPSMCSLLGTSSGRRNPSSAISIRYNTALQSHETDGRKRFCGDRAQCEVRAKAEETLHHEAYNYSTA